MTTEWDDGTRGKSDDGTERETRSGNSSVSGNLTVARNGGTEPENGVRKGTEKKVGVKTSMVARSEKCGAKNGR